MWFFRRINPLESIKGIKYISFVGAGGKTSFAEYLGEEFSLRGEKVAVTTTTKIYAKEPYLLVDNLKSLINKTGQFVRIGKAVENGKLTSLSSSEIEYIGGMYDRVLIEADGAKGKPIKWHASHEPVIPDISDMVFVVAGLDAFGCRIRDIVFRWELFCNASGTRDNEIIDNEAFLRFFSEDALLKGLEGKDFKIVLNKYDLLTDRKTGIDIAKHLVRKLMVDEVYVASINFAQFYSVKNKDLT